jgi:hypothetical protein
LGFAPLPGGIAALVAGILLAYCLVSEGAKRPFYARARKRTRMRLRDGD